MVSESSLLIGLVEAIGALASRQNGEELTIRVDDERDPVALSTSDLIARLQKEREVRENPTLAAHAAVQALIPVLLTALKDPRVRQEIQRIVAGQ